MKLSEGLLWVTCVLFVGFGLGFAIAPQQLAHVVTDAKPTVPSALIDMRATYGGVALGIGLFIGLCARRPSWVRAGLVASLLTVVAIGSVRVLGIIVDGSPNVFMLIFLATEVIFTGLYVLALRRLG